ncbi:MAG: hypothetical protein RL660_113 [Bacteroidota bacterium]|jgi:hypothetical protein
MMRIIYLILLLLIAMPLISAAQNNLIFYGGNGAGAIKASNATNYTRVTTGGLGEGTSFGNHVTAENNIRLGGFGEGSALALHLQQKPEVRLGGIGDGSAQQTYSQTYTALRLGGFGDGVAAGAYYAIYNEPRKGGEGDGYASVVMPTIPLNPLAADGFAFSGKQLGNKTHLLEWLNVKVEDVSYYRLERSSNASSWQTISNTIESFGTADYTYSYVDETPLAGNNFYRVRIVDKQGKFTYSNIVTLISEEAGAIRIFPNPTASELNIDLTASTAPTHVMLVGSNGQLVYQEVHMTGMSKLDLSNLAQGTYILKLQTKQRQYSYKILKR